MLLKLHTQKAKRKFMGPCTVQSSGTSSVSVTPAALPTSCKCTSADAPTHIGGYPYTHITHIQSLPCRKAALRLPPLRSRPQRRTAPSEPAHGQLQSDAWPRRLPRMSLLKVMDSLDTFLDMCYRRSGKRRKGLTRRTTDSLLLYGIAAHRAGSVASAPKLGWPAPGKL